MSKLKTVGKFDGRVLEHESNGFFESTEKKTPGIRLMLAVVGGENDGEETEWTGWLSDGAFDNTIKRLNQVFKFSGDMERLAADPQMFAELPCHFETEDEEDDKGNIFTRVKWLNAPGGGNAPVMAPDAAKALAARLTRRAQALLKSPLPKRSDTPPAGEKLDDDRIPY